MVGVKTWPNDVGTNVWSTGHNTFKVLAFAGTRVLVYLTTVRHACTSDTLLSHKCLSEWRWPWTTLCRRTHLCTGDTPAPTPDLHGNRLRGVLKDLCLKVMIVTMCSPRSLPKNSKYYFHFIPRDKVPMGCFFQGVLHREMLIVVKCCQGRNDVVLSRRNEGTASTCLCLSSNDLFPAPSRSKAQPNWKRLKYCRWPLTTSKWYMPKVGFTIFFLTNTTYKSFGRCKYLNWIE